MMKHFSLVLSAAFLLATSLALRADDSVPRGLATTSGFDLDLAATFYETINGAVASTVPVTIPSVTGSTTLAGSVLVQDDTSINNTLITLYPKNLPAAPYQVYVTLLSTGTQRYPVGSFVMPAIISTYQDISNNRVLSTDEIVLKPVPVAPQPDNDFSGSANSLGYSWLSSGIVRFATPGTPDLTIKIPRKGKVSGTILTVPTGDFDPDINPFDISSVLVTNANTGATLLTNTFKGDTSLDTTTTNLRSLVLPTSTEGFAGGIANVKTSFSRTKTKLTRTGSLNFSAAGLPAAKAYDILINGDLKDTVTSNSKGAVVITSSTLAVAKKSSGLTVLAGVGMDFFGLSSITLVDHNTQEEAMWTAF